MLSGGTWLRWLRLTRFAEANGLRFAPLGPNPDYPGAIFGMNFFSLVSSLF